MSSNEWLFDLVAHDLDLNDYELMQLEDILLTEDTEETEEPLPEWLAETTEMR